MKKLLKYSALLVLIGCKGDVYPTIPTVTGGGEPSPELSLGVASTGMNIVSTSNTVTTGPFTVSVNVTPGATYSFQLTHIDGTVLHNHGFTATSNTMSIPLNYSTIPVGAYDLVLMDNTGRLLKVAVIIQR